MKKEQRELFLLNTIRWMCALIVACAHALSFVFRVPAAGRIGTAVTYCSNTGHAAVMIFFAISGYLVGGSVLERWQAFDFQFYAVSRFSRIYVVLIPAVLMMAALDGLAHLASPASPIYTTLWAGPISNPIFNNYTVRNFFATILSLESVIGAPLGSNHPLWSLGYEWFFYILFPGALGVLGKLRINGKPRHLLVTVGTAAIMAGLGARYMAVYWLIWTAGAYAKLAADQRLGPRWLPRAGGAAALAAFLIAPMVNWRYTDPVIGFGFALLLTDVALLRGGLNRSVDHALAGFSYSLYIVHQPVMVFMMLLFVNAGLTTADRLPFGWHGLALWLALVTGGVTFGYLFGFLFERRTDDLRRFLLRRLKSSPILPAATPAA